MVSIAIVNYKNPPLLRLCLESLSRALAKTKASEIIVVDIASRAPTRNIVLEEFPKVKLIPFKNNIGYTRGVNEGIKASKGDYILFLNSDVVPLREAIEKMAKYMKENPEIGLLGPQLLNFDGTPQKTCFRFYNLWTIILRRTFLGRLPFARKTLARFTMEDKKLNEPTRVDWLMGSALMASRKAINEVGPMDEELFLYMSDVDWPRRFWQKGFSVVYYPLAQMYHYHRRESKGRYGAFDVFFNRQTRWHILDALKYFRKYGIINPDYNK